MLRFYKNNQMADQAQMIAGRGLTAKNTIVKTEV